MTKYRLTRRSFLTRSMGLAMTTGLTLAGCASPPQPAGKLTPAQVTVLQGQGFELTGSGWELGATNKVLFGFDEAVITQERLVALLRIGHVLHDAGIDALRIDGHTDDAGPAEYNQLLSMRRAEAVARVLATCGFTRSQLLVRGLGKTHPISDNRTALGRAENRRVAIIVSVD